jgi:exopolysaccharide biosynthesis polyprenyl glycosylphosphotransferase
MTAVDAVQVGTAHSWVLGGRARRLTRPWERTYVAALIVVDACAAWAAGMIAYASRFMNGDAGHSYVLLGALSPPLWLACIGANRAYESRYLGVGSEEFRRVMTAAVWLTAGVGTFSWITKAELARGYMLVALPALAVFTLVGRYAARKRLHWLRARGGCIQRLVVVGEPEPTATLVRRLRNEPYHGLEVVGACLPAGSSTTPVEAANVEVVGTFDTVVEAVHRSKADTVAVLACPDMYGLALRRLSWGLERYGTDILVAPTLVEVAGPRIAIRPIAGLPLLHVDHPELTGGRRIMKALFDRCVAGILLLLLAPVLFVIAMSIKLTSPGPVLFRQLRIGRHGEPFTMVKFRTMVTDAERLRADLIDLNQHHEGPLFKIKDDPRVTRVGARLRHYSLDELPQLINVLLGDMSLVGPRPPLPAEVTQYGLDARRRLAVKPGLTGLWQISGRSNLDWEESVRLDLRYVENWSLALDTLILWKTLFVVARGDGAY